MFGQAQIGFLEADVAYRRQRLRDEFVRVNRASRRRRGGWVHQLVEATRWGRRNDPRRGAIRWAGDGPILRPAGAPHHMASP